MKIVVKDNDIFDMTRKHTDSRYIVGPWKFHLKYELVFINDKHIFKLIHFSKLTYKLVNIY